MDIIVFYSINLSTTQITLGVFHKKTDTYEISHVELALKPRY